MAIDDNNKLTNTQIEFVDVHKKAGKPVVGTIKFIDDGGIVLIPTPTSDPNGMGIFARLLYMHLINTHPQTP